MAQKTIIELPEARPAKHESLPHAAMSLGSAGAGGLRPAARMVKKLVFEEQFGSWVLYRIDASGGFVGDSWHQTKDDAIRQAKREFGELEI